MPKQLERKHTDYTCINNVKIMRDDFIKTSFITTDDKMINYILKRYQKYLFKTDI